MEKQNSLIDLEYKVLDNGFIRVVDIMGDDSSVVQAARISYGKGTKTVNTDKNLLRYLMRHQHSTPFEMCEIKLHIKLPIFIMRQWIRHRTANVNEYSARYSQMKDEFYYPSKDMLQKQSMLNKQAGEGSIDENQYNITIDNMKAVCQTAFTCYEKMLNNGIAREVARIVLPINIYTQMYWKIDLHNLMRFLSLRCRMNAQPEIREYAMTILNIFEKWMPLSYQAFMDYIYHAHIFSSSELNIIKRSVNFDKISEVIEESDALSQREKSEMHGKIKMKSTLPDK